MKKNERKDGMPVLSAGDVKTYLRKAGVNGLNPNRIAGAYLQFAAEAATATGPGIPLQPNDFLDAHVSAWELVRKISGNGAGTKSPGVEKIVESFTWEQLAAQYGITPVIEGYGAESMQRFLQNKFAPQPVMLADVIECMGIAGKRLPGDYSRQPKFEQRRAMERATLAVFETYFGYSPR
ncbi:hypothetical protein HYU13_02205 [Candidatus Woesearchaeota archaeon]|nr:hypothetical protein [Candidatus Woesearchaeota archaeon]